MSRLKCIDQLIQILIEDFGKFVAALQRFKKKILCQVKFIIIDINPYQPSVHFV